MEPASAFGDPRASCGRHRPTARAVCAGDVDARWADSPDAALGGCPASGGQARTDPSTVGRYEPLRPGQLQAEAVVHTLCAPRCRPTLHDGRRTAPEGDGSAADRSRGRPAPTTSLTRTGRPIR